MKINKFFEKVVWFTLSLCILSQGIAPYLKRWTMQRGLFLAQSTKSVQMSHTHVMSVTLAGEFPRVSVTDSGHLYPNVSVSRYNYINEHLSILPCTRGFDRVRSIILIKLYGHLSLSNLEIDYGSELKMSIYLSFSSFELKIIVNRLEFYFK